MVKRSVPSTRSFSPEFRTEGLRTSKQTRSPNASVLQRTLNQRDRELGILLEDVNGKFDTLAEGHQNSNRQFSEFRDEMTGFRDGMLSFRSEMLSFRDETRHSLAEIRAELRSIRGEIESLRRSLTQKADLNRLEELERRVQILEHGLTRSTNNKK